MKSSGTWWIKSKSDPRWNCSGHDNVGMFDLSFAKAEVEKKKRILGEEPPKDLEAGYMKD